jgi:PEP-CTERM motif
MKRISLIFSVSIFVAGASQAAIVLELGTIANAGGTNTYTNVYSVNALGVPALTSSTWTTAPTPGTAETPTGDTGPITPFTFSFTGLSASAFNATTGIESTLVNFAVNARGVSVAGGPGGNFTSSTATVSEGNVFYFNVPTGYSMTISKVYLDAVNTFDAFDSFAVINGINDTTTGEIDIDEVAIPTQGWFTLPSPIALTGNGANQHTLTVWNPGGTDGDAAGGWRVDRFEVAFAAVPEPSSVLLGGLGFLALLRRRR